MRRLKAVGAALRRIGPRPVLLLRYVAHKLLTYRRMRRLRRQYGVLVATVPGGAELRPIGPDLPPVDRLPGPLAAAAAEIRREADDAVAHRVTLLGTSRAELGEKISWDLDFKSGYRWPPVFYQDLQVTRLGDDSDAKVPWELSRSHHLLALARAAVLFGEESYAQELESQLADWIEANPPGLGINWVNPMEVSIRAVNWIWALTTLERSGTPLDPGLRRLVTESLQVHGRHIATNLEGTPYLRSNHYLADIVGLLAIGSCIDDDPAATGWADTAHRELERQIMRQVLPDGISFEASLAYHGLVLEMLLLARHLARTSGQPLSKRFDARLGRMLDASRCLRHPDGRIPQFGDNDSGRILPATGSRPPTHDHLLWLGAAELGRGRPLPGLPDAEVAWTFGVAAWEAVERVAEQPQPAVQRFDHGGIFILRGGGTSVVVRCADVGQNGNGGHAHNDLLSYELARNRPLVVDSGTYVYTADPLARNAFRSTAAHNTVAIDGEEINPIDPAELFRLRQVARPQIEAFESSEGAVSLTCAHDGFRRLPCRATHRRAFSLDRETGALSILDTIEGGGECECASYVHLSPGCKVRAQGSDAEVVGPGGDRFIVHFEGVTSLGITQGWVSNAYGQREKAPVIIGRRSGRLPAGLHCRFEFGQYAERPAGREGARATQGR